MAMTMRLGLALLAAPLWIGCGAPALAQSVSFGSPVVLGPGDPRQGGNVTCYVSNVGKRVVQVENLEMFGVRGTIAPTSNTCGPLAGFGLAPGATCFVGAAFGFRPNGVACRARSSAAAQLRGSIEARSRGQVVVESASLTVGTNPGTPEVFRAIASPPLFGSPQQTDARCSFTNVGDADARLKEFRFVRSDGSPAPMAYNDCAATGEFVLGPKKTCEIGMSFSGGPVTDIQCRAQTTRKADIRGMLRILESGLVRNSRPLE